MSHEGMSEETKSRLAADYWKRANEAVSKQNWDYAIECMLQCIKFYPDRLVYRQVLRGTQEKKYKNNGKGATMAAMRVMGAKAKIKKARFSKDWAAVEAAAEEGLQLNPWDTGLLADLGEALREQGYLECAVDSYTRAVRADPKNKDYNRALGELLAERGEYQRAIECFQRVLQADPLDSAARQRITQLNAASVMDRGGYEKAEATRDVARTAAARAKDADGPGMSLEADLQRAIRKDPANKNNYLKLADYYRREGKLADSAAQLEAALQVSGGDVSIREQLEDVQLDQMRQAVALARDDAARNPEDAALRKRFQETAAELRKREIDVMSRRTERYPQDLRLKFELGKRLFEEHKHQLAIPLFQQARSDSRLKAESLFWLGKCFITDKEYALAKRQLEQAIPDLNADDRPEVFKETHYLLARVLEKLNDREGAIRHLQEVLVADYNYRDTKQRLTALEAGQPERAE